MPIRFTRVKAGSQQEAIFDLRASGDGKGHTVVLCHKEGDAPGWHQIHTVFAPLPESPADQRAMIWGAIKRDIPEREIDWRFVLEGEPTDGGVIEGSDEWMALQ